MGFRNRLGREPAPAPADPQPIGMAGILAEAADRADVGAALDELERAINELRAELVDTRLLTE